MQSVKRIKSVGRNNAPVILSAVAAAMHAIAY